MTNRDKQWLDEHMAQVKRSISNMISCSAGSIYNSSTIQILVNAAIQGFIKNFEGSGDLILVQNVCDCIRSWNNTGYTVNFIKRAFEISSDDEEEIFDFMSESEISRELDSVLRKMGISGECINLIHSKWYSGFEPIHYSDFYEWCKIYSRAYQKALPHYNNNKTKAITFADSCWYSGRIPNFNIKLESILYKFRRWKCTLCIHFDDAFEYEAVYNADYILGRLYECDDLDIDYDGCELTASIGYNMEATFEPF